MTSLFIPAQLTPDAALVVSISGGKDSDAMLSAIVAHAQREKWRNEIVAVHADLGRAEWDETHDYVTRLTDKHHVPLIIVRHTYGDLIDGIRRRMATRPDAPPFPSSAARWCTSDWKRAIIDRWIRQTYKADRVILCAMGLRADESAARAKRNPLTPRPAATAKTKNRFTYDWLPIHHWSLSDVWGEIGYSLDDLSAIQKETKRTSRPPVGFKAHPAYAYGNERLSCALCVLGSMNDLLNGASHNPKTYRELCQIEIESGFSFRQNLWLGSIRPHLLRPDQADWYISKGII